VPNNPIMTSVKRRRCFKFIFMFFLVS